MNKQNNTKIGYESLPPPSKIEGLQAITKLSPISGCRYYVYTYALNKDIIDKDGKVDDFRGMFFILGSFDNKNEAEAHLEKLIIKTKHSEFYIAEYAKPIRIETNTDPSNISRVYVDTNNKIKQLESEQYEKDKEFYEKRIKLEKEIVEEAENEYNVDHIDHFKRQCYLAVKNRMAFEKHKDLIEKTNKDIEKCAQNYEKYKSTIREHYKNHPEHEDQWLPYLKNKLIERNELHMYNLIESEYLKYRNELLDIQ